MFVPRLLNLLMIFQSEIAETMDWLITYLLGSAALVDAIQRMAAIICILSLPMQWLLSPLLRTGVANVVVIFSNIKLK